MALRTGRKPGSKDKQPRMTAARKAAAAAIDGKITPLEVMLKTMRDRWKKSERESDPAKKDEHRAVACAIAEKAAPFVHAKLAAVMVDANLHHDADQLTDAQLTALAGGSRPSLTH